MKILLVMASIAMAGIASLLLSKARQGDGFVSQGWLDDQKRATPDDGMPAVGRRGRERQDHDRLSRYDREVGA